MLKYKITVRSVGGQKLYNRVNLVETIKVNYDGAVYLQQPYKGAT